MDFSQILEPLNNLSSFLNSVGSLISSIVSSTLDGLDMIASSLLFIGQIHPYLPSFLVLSVGTVISISVIKLIWGR